MRQPNVDCVVIFLARRHTQSAELLVLSSGVDDANCEVNFCAALHPSKQVLDLFDGICFGVARAINHQPALRPASSAGLSGSTAVIKTPRPRR